MLHVLVDADGTTAAIVIRASRSKPSPKMANSRCSFEIPRSSSVRELLPALRLACQAVVGSRLSESSALVSPTRPRSARSRQRPPPRPRLGRIPHLPPPSGLTVPASRTRTSLMLAQAVEFDACRAKLLSFDLERNCTTLPFGSSCSRRPSPPALKATGQRDVPEAFRHKLGILAAVQPRGVATHTVRLCAVTAVRALFRRDPNHAEYWKFSWDGGASSSCGDIHSNWVANRTSFAFSGPISRCYVVLEFFGMDLSIPMQMEYAMFGRDQGVGTGRFEQTQAGIPASCEDELAVTSEGI